MDFSPPTNQIMMFSAPQPWFSCRCSLQTHDLTESDVQDRVRCLRAWARRPEVQDLEGGDFFRQIRPGTGREGARLWCFFGGFRDVRCPKDPEVSKHRVRRVFKPRFPIFNHPPAFPCFQLFGMTASGALLSPKKGAKQVPAPRRGI